MTTQDPHIDPDDAEIDLTLFRDTWRRYRRVVVLIASGAALAVGIVQTWQYVRAPQTFTATQELRLVLNDQNEFVDGVPFRLADLTRPSVIDRVYLDLGLKAHVTAEALTAAITGHGVRTSQDEYAVRYQVTRPGGLPEAMAPQVLAAVIGEWRRDIQATRRSLGELALLLPEPEEHTSGTLLVRADTARRQLDRYTDRLREIATRVPPAKVGVIDPRAVLAELSQRVQDLQRTELLPIILQSCRSTALTDADRRYLEGRALEERLAAQSFGSRAGVAELLAKLRTGAEPVPSVVSPVPADGRPPQPTVVVPGYVLPSGSVSLSRPPVPGGALDAGLLQQMYDLGRNSAETEARRRAMVDLRDLRQLEAAAVRERSYYDVLLAAAGGPRGSNDPAVLDAKFSAFGKELKVAAGRASDVARRILDWDHGMEGVDYFVGPYTESVTRATSGGVVAAWTALAFALALVAAFTVCVFFQMRRPSRRPVA